MISHAELLLADGTEAAPIARALSETRPPDTAPAVGAVAQPPCAGRGGRRAIGTLRRASRAKSWRSLAAAPRRGSWGAACASSVS